MLRANPWPLVDHSREKVRKRGGWAFKDGASTLLGAKLALCKYEQLLKKPGPFYDENKWYE